ncbi:hypothetical protein QEJ31_01905 [Pigmentibacter sp. JX0631]|uniref:hypothetical protein n=1 Tax=Pigmentibacter sp. JX0631 TaxID=2976982 RepID=UPI00246950FB|nr:hypothetical protein [Pigmentibacter sp. JX0631]WGL60357.1 hypothetical protein QEJ31_01905 [Pigmentibacter sp. JX0631]
MENNKNKLLHTENKTTPIALSSGDETKQLWKIYTKKKQSKDLRKAILLGFVVFFLILLVVAGLYIILSTTDPTHSK